MLSPRIRINWLACCWWSIAAVLCSVGCGTRNTYHVEMRLAEEGFVRTVDVASHPRPGPQPESDEPADPLISEEEQKVFAAIYGPAERGSESVRFRKTCSESTPDDVGGSGSLIRWRSELGETFVYHERFRGRLPTLRQRLLREAAIDKALGWVSDWLDEELTGVAGAAELQQFVKNDLRTDLQDLACLLEVAAARVPDRSSEERDGSVLLIAHFLIERGYLSFADIAQLPLHHLSESEQLAWMVERFRRKLVTATGLAANNPVLQRLSEAETLGHRFMAFLGRTPEYRLWRDEQLAGDVAAAVEPSTFLGEALEPVLGPLFVGTLTWGGFDELTLVLHTAAEPLETNGRWEAESGSVRWQWRLTQRPALQKESDWLYSGLPRVAFAQWVRADQPRQMALFGSVLIEGAVLRDYCLWRQRLDEPQAARWQELLEQLPDVAAADRIGKLTEFKQHWSEEFDTTPSVLDTLINGLADPSAK